MLTPLPRQHYIAKRVCNAVAAPCFVDACILYWNSYAVAKDYARFRYGVEVVTPGRRGRLAFSFCLQAVLADMVTTGMITRAKGDGAGRGEFVTRGSGVFQGLGFRV